jgi:hypothetical protein
VKGDGRDVELGKEGVEVRRCLTARGEDDGRGRPRRRRIGIVGGGWDETSSGPFLGRGGGRGGWRRSVWVRTVEVLDRFRWVEEEVVQVGFSDVRGDEEVMLFELGDRSCTAEGMG